MNSNLKTFRHELKYYINYFEYEALKRRLASILKRDKYADDNGDYHIRSLYFDDEFSSALFEKQAGILQREKFRIRIYNLQDNIIKLEKKSRVGQFIHKESATISKEQYGKIVNNNIEFLKESSNKLFNELYFHIKAKNLKPTVIVDYVREAYVYNINNIRITFDKQLRSGLHNVDIFDKSMPTIDVIEKPLHILEIKYDHFLPDFIKNLLQIKSSQRYAISKYVICRKFTKNNSWEDN